MLKSGFVEFKLDWAATKTLAVDDVVLSDEFSAGGHIWRVRCYPHGTNGGYGLHLSVYLQLVSKSEDVKAIFDAFLMRSDGEPSASYAHRCLRVYLPDGFNSWGFPRFVKRADLESSDYVKDGHVRFMIGVIVLPRDEDDNGHRAMPSSDIGGHLGRLLDGADGPDVSMIVGGEIFRVHRAVLAAGSPVFKAQLLGSSMAEATRMRCVTLHGIKPATFQILLRFMYTDQLPRDEEIEQSSSPATIEEVFQNLLAAADMFQLERLKLVYAQKLWKRVSPENVATVLGCAETHQCSELKNRCLEFFVVEKNFKVAVLTEGYFRLMPSVIDEIRERVQS